MYFIFGENEQCELMCKSQAMFQPLKDISLTRHSDKLNTVRKRKKSRCKTPYKIMTDNQNMIKHLWNMYNNSTLFKTSSRVNEKFLKTFFLSKQDFRKLSLIFTGNH